MVEFEKILSELRQHEGSRAEAKTRLRSLEIKLRQCHEALQTERGEKRSLQGSLHEVKRHLTKTVADLVDAQEEIERKANALAAAKFTQQRRDLAFLDLALDRCADRADRLGRRRWRRRRAPAVRCSSTRHLRSHGRRVLLRRLRLRR